ncbi:MAG TPA: hypothetical protein VK420_11275 [Longimicrobium sp.]|nr:hypothetical protein [Longimicrobium sp.]
MPTKKKIGEILIESGAASEDDVKNALGQQRAFGAGRRLGEVMVSLKMITPTALARALAQQSDLPFVQLPEIPQRVTALVPLEFQAEHRLVPFRLESEGRGDRLHIAVEDPSRLELVDELRFQLAKAVRVYVAAADDIENTLALLRGDGEEIIEALDIDEEDSGEELQVERTAAMSAVGNWFGGGPGADAAKALAIDNWDLPGSSEPAAPKPAEAAAAPKPAAQPPPPPSAAPGSAGSPVRSAQADLDELFGASAPPVPAPAPTAAPVQVVSFHRTSPPPPPAEAPAEPGPAPTASARPAASAVTPAPVAAAMASAPPAAAPPAPEAPTELSRPKLEISDADLQILDELDRMAQGSEPALDSEKVRPARMVASLIRLLIRKGVIHELEFLEELARK